MPITTLPPAVNTYNTDLRSALDQRFATTPINVQAETDDPGNPNGFLIEAIDTFEASLDGFGVAIALLEQQVEATYAPLESPVLTGNPTAPTANTNDNSNTISTTAFVKSVVSGAITGVSAGQPLYLDTANNLVGINNTSPAHALSVTGNAYISSTLTVLDLSVSNSISTSNTLTVNGHSSLATANASGNTRVLSLGVGTAASGTAGEIRATDNITSYYSDDRLKTRLGNIENALDKIDQLTGFYYEANDLAQSMGYAKTREVGVSAQDTKRIMGEIVAPAPIDDRYLTVRYEKFAPLLIEGIKELRTEINKIKQHLNI